MHRRAFTLMELLLVVAIIALLVALLLPVFQQARKKSYEPVCTSNLRQFYVAFSLYREDYGDAPKYQTQLLPYIKDKRILRCPADSYQRGAAWIHSGPLSMWIETSYYYYRPDTDDFRDLMERLDPNHGIAVCILHGRRSRYPQGPVGDMDYSGKVLRLRLDGSVQIGNGVRVLCFREDGVLTQLRHPWLNFTDIRPIPREVLDTTDLRGRQVWECEPDDAFRMFG